MSYQYRSASKMPFKWHFAGGPTLSRFFMFSFDVSFDIMRKSTIIFSDKHFWCSKESSGWEGSFEHQNLALKVIENTILHTTRQGGYSDIRRLVPFFGVQNSEFQYFLGFSEKWIFVWGMKILWILFWGHHKIGLVWGSFLCNLGSFFKVKVQNWDIWVAKISNIFLGCLEFLIFFLGER